MCLLIFLYESLFELCKCLNLVQKTSLILTKISFYFLLERGNSLGCRSVVPFSCTILHVSFSDSVHSPFQLGGRHVAEKVERREFYWLHIGLESTAFCQRSVQVPVQIFYRGFINTHITSGASAFSTFEMTTIRDTSWERLKHMKDICPSAGMDGSQPYEYYSRSSVMSCMTD